MILDKQNTLSEHQAITATAVSANIIDFGSANHRSDEGEPVQLLLAVEDTFLSGGATTLTVTFETDDNEAFSSPKVLLSTRAIAKADLVRGFQLPISFLPAELERYGRLNYTVATGPFTAGKINAGLVQARQTNR